MRAIRARYDPYVQARGRVDQLRKLGMGVIDVQNSTDVGYPPPPPPPAPAPPPTPPLLRACMSTHPEGKSRSNLGQAVVVSDPAVRFRRVFKVGKQIMSAASSTT